MPKAKSRVQVNNKRASFDYEFLETYQAGIVLVGTEIKSIRAGRASMSDAFCFFEGGQLYVRGINIALYTWGSWGQHAPLRDRKLLLQKRELRHLQQKVKEKGLTIFPLPGERRPMTSASPSRKRISGERWPGASKPDRHFCRREAMLLLPEGILHQINAVEQLPSEELEHFLHLLAVTDDLHCFPVWLPSEMPV